MDQEVTLNIVVNIISDSLGQNGLEQSEVDLAIQELHNSFKQVGIEFSVICNKLESNFCFDDAWSCFNDPDYLADNCLNLFLIPRRQSTGVAYGEGIAGLKTALCFYEPNNGIVEHEMGHVFTLLHTFGIFGNEEHVTRNDTPCPS